MAHKHFLVIGLGSFGTALALRLSENGCRVTGLDLRRDRVELLKDELYEAVIGDATERETLEHLGVDTVDAVFISLGENIALSLLAALHAKELKARQVVVKGVTDEHGRILKRLGVDRVVFPETEVARELADRLTWPNVLDFLPIDPEYSVVEIAVADSCNGRTIRDCDLRRRFGISILGVKDVLSGKLKIFPDPEFRLTDDQVLLVVGREKEIEQLRELE